MVVLREPVNRISANPHLSSGRHSNMVQLQQSKVLQNGIDQTREHDVLVNDSELRLRVSGHYEDIIKYLHQYEGIKNLIASSEIDGHEVMCEIILRTERKTLASRDMILSHMSFDDILNWAIPKLESDMDRDQVFFELDYSIWII